MSATPLLPVTNLNVVNLKTFGNGYIDLQDVNANVIETSDGNDFNVEVNMVSVKRIYLGGMLVYGTAP
jgi:hypothetical protein